MEMQIHALFIMSVASVTNYDKDVGGKGILAIKQTIVVNPCLHFILKKKDSNNNL